MEAGRWVAIVNPRSGDREGGEQVARVLQRLGAVEILETAGPGEAEALARQAVAGGESRLLAVGGDGTLHEVVNGIAPDFGRVRVGLLPVGTGNDFARSAGIPEGLDAAVEVIREGRVVRVDLMEVRSGGRLRYGINASTGGFAGVVDQKVGSREKEWLGRFAYILSAGRALPELERYRAWISADGGTEESLELYNFSVSNGRTVAGGLALAPGARVCDGLLEVLLVPCLPAPRLAAEVGRLLLGRTAEEGELIRLSARAFEIRTEPPVPFNVDGELAGTTPVSYRVIARALQFVTGVRPGERETPEGGC